tara:strand:- start:25 stop:582 length:558 start_codon:yes stop_codon:yes gene_type:complete
MIDLNYLQNSFSQSILSYVDLMKSKHWKKYYDEKKKLYAIKNLKNFRNNGLSEGLDDRAQNLTHLEKLFNSLIKKCGKNFIFDKLDTNNIGLNKHYVKFKDLFIDLNQIFIINFYYELNKHTPLNKNKIICEIGGGYGHLVRLILSNHKTKIILIDLPEANFISSYYLMENFTKNKIYIYLFRLF